MPRRLVLSLAWAVIVLLAIALRLNDLGERPIHADEATGARILAKRLEGQSASFDPTHFHGPLLSLTSAPLARLRGEQNWEALTKPTLRLGPLLAGVLMVLTPLLWIRQIGPFGALAAAAFLATSPLLTYYSRMYIHESLLALFTMLGCFTVFRLAEKPGLLQGALAGFCIGLMFATKETFVITLTSWVAGVAAYFVYRLCDHTATAGIPRLRRYFGPSAMLVLTASITAGYFYSDGFRSLAGLVDAVRTYFVYETVPGHEKPFGYYLDLLLWPTKSLGLWWSEAFIALFAVLACVLALSNRANRGVVLFLAVAALAQILIYSFIRYKTPWLMVVPWAHACLLAGCAFSAIREWRPALRITLSLLLLCGVSYQTWQTVKACGRFSNDSRMPYAYVPTTADVEALEQWFHALEDTQQDPQTLGPVAVVGSGYWPLPWYLRDFGPLTYQPTPAAELEEYPVVIAMPEQFTATSTLLENTHTKLPRGLRANVAVMLYLRNDVWEAWMKDAPQ